ncbi:hypothetical protein [Pseudokordiimonas caeni]|uniref:hypothetical protein n=1 Tax=Pseudokordiimonas caeni TaxID=2997908 RepID=UPI002810E9BD|nr:hypothetical protein [Pseudokordiimonas caeni]
MKRLKALTAAFVAALVLATLPASADDAAALRNRIAVSDIADRTGTKTLTPDFLKSGQEAVVALLEQKDRYRPLTRDLLQSDLDDPFSRLGADATIGIVIQEINKTSEVDKGFLKRKKTETASIRVEFTLSDAQTSSVIYQVTADGNSQADSKTILGLGKKDEKLLTIEDRAFNAALEAVSGRLLEKLDARPWRTSIRSIDGDRLLLSAGDRDGLQLGDRLAVVRRGFAMGEGPAPIDWLATVEVETFNADSRAVARLVEDGIAGAGDWRTSQGVYVTRLDPSKPF